MKTLFAILAILNRLLLIDNVVNERVNFVVLNATALICCMINMFGN